MLAGLRHRAVSCVHNQDRAVHLRRTGDHVLHVVGVAGAVDVRVVAVLGLIFHVCGGDGDAAGFFFRRAVDLVVGLEVTEVFGDCCGQRGFAVVNVADGADVDVRFRAFKLFLSHGMASFLL